MERTGNMKVLRNGFERLLLIVGLLLLSFYVAARIYGVVSSRAELSRFCWLLLAPRCAGCGPVRRARDWGGRLCTA